MSGDEICGICGEVEESPLVECFECGTRFHLNPRKDRPGKDCGDAFLGDSMGIEMICNNCIDLRRAGDDPAANMLGMYAAMTGGALPVPPTPRATPPRPGRPTQKPAAERPRRRFRRIDG